MGSSCNTYVDATICMHVLLEEGRRTCLVNDEQWEEEEEEFYIYIKHTHSLSIYLYSHCVIQNSKCIERSKVGLKTCLEGKVNRL